MILEYLAQKTLDEIYSKIKRVYNDNNYKIEFSKSDLENSLDHHLNFIRNWSEQISFKDLSKNKKLDKVYIDLDLYLIPLKLQMDESEKAKIIPLNEILNRSDNHLVILGQPGAGKTTSMKKVCQLCLFDSEKVTYNFPIYFALRDLPRNSSSLYEYILKSFGIVVINNEGDKVSHEFYEKIISNLLDDFNAIVILDGFDELPFDLKSNVSRDIRKLSLLLNKSKICVTSRTGDFDINIENSNVYEIKELSSFQVEKFVEKWLGKEDAISFLKQLSDSPFADTTIRPLNLSHLCAIYERIGKIPDKPKTVYKKIVNLLLEEWDEQREIRRNSIYSNFEVDRKREFLSNLSFILTTKYDTTRFDSSIIKRIYLDYLYENFALPKEEVRLVISELEDHTGLFFQSSYNEYEFSHKSVQEFLCAEYIVSLPKIPSNYNLIAKIPNEMAIATSISSNPTLFFSSLILETIFKQKWFDVRTIESISFEDKILVNRVYKDFLEIFLNRIMVEKVDFNSSPLLGVTLLYLYTILNSVNDKNISNSLRSLMFDFLRIKPVNRSISFLTNYYEIRDSARTKKQQLIIKEDTEIEYMKLPKYLNFQWDFLDQ